MKLRCASINTYLLCAGLALFGTGCALLDPGADSEPSKEKKEKTATKKLTKEEKNTLAFMRFHQQTVNIGDDRAAVINVFRSNPVEMTVTKMPFMDETLIERSEVVDEGEGAFSLKVKFDRRGSVLLETMTGLNLNSHIAIWTAFGVMGSETNHMRWLAAPFVRTRISDGTLVFTPDATRQEAEQIALGLNNAAERLRKQDLLRPR